MDLYSAGNLISVPNSNDYRDIDLCGSSGVETVSSPIVTATMTTKVTVSIPIVEYIAKTTNVEVDYEFFNKKFPGLMTEEQFNKFAEENCEQFEAFEWNNEQNPTEEEGDHHDEEAWFECLDDPDENLSGYDDELKGLKRHIKNQVNTFLGKNEEEEDEEEEEEEEEED